jgi:hypothetical protein
MAQWVVSGLEGVRATFFSGRCQVYILQENLHNIELIYKPNLLPRSVGSAWGQAYTIYISM